MPPWLYKERSCALRYLFKKNVHTFDHVTRSVCSSHILLWCYVRDLIQPRREKQVVNHLLVPCSKRLQSATTLIKQSQHIIKAFYLCTKQRLECFIYPSLEILLGTSLLAGSSALSFGPWAHVCDISAFLHNLSYLSLQKADSTFLP